MNLTLFYLVTRIINKFGLDIKCCKNEEKQEVYVIEIKAVEEILSRSALYYYLDLDFANIEDHYDIQSIKFKTVRDYYHFYSRNHAVSGLSVLINQYLCKHINKPI